MAKYSFVLPAFKARFFREAIDSILAQTYTEFELIIVNDASPEDLDSIVKSLKNLILNGIYVPRTHQFYGELKNSTFNLNVGLGDKIVLYSPYWWITHICLQLINKVRG